MKNNFKNINEKEVWKDLKNYEGLYKVSNLGRIKSLPRKGAPGEKILKTPINKGGYKIAGLRKEGKTQYYYVHRLVAEAFISNSDNLPCVNHKDCNTTNNCVWVNEDGTIDPEKSNLEWCTFSYNLNYGDRNQKMLETRKKYSLSRAEKQIKQLSLNGQLITIWSSICEASRNGYDRSAIIRCCKLKAKKHKGYKWEYINF